MGLSFNLKKGPKRGANRNKIFVWKKKGGGGWGWWVGGAVSVFR